MILEKWQNLSLAQQLGNIGSEISRARHWDEARDADSRNQAIERALELIDLTLSDYRWRFRLKEITRLREVVAGFFAGTDFYRVSWQVIDKFCLDFALIARR